MQPALADFRDRFRIVTLPRMFIDYKNNYNSNNNRGGGKVDNFFLLPYYSEKRRKIQAFCPDFAKQTNFSSGDSPVDKAVERIVPSVEKRKNICSRAGRPACRKG